jgi:hypothetical protein
MGCVRRPAGGWCECWCLFFKDHDKHGIAEARLQVRPIDHGGSPLSAYALDRPGLIFATLSLLLVCWAVFNTPGFFRVLSLGTKKTVTRLELLVIRVPGTIVIIAIVFMIVATAVSKL